MNKILVIGRTEFLEAIRSKAFLIGFFMMPVLMAISIGFQEFAENQVDLKPRRCAISDPTGEVWAALEPALLEYNEKTIWEEDEDGERKQVKPTFELELVQLEDVEDPDLGLADRVRGGELQGYLLVAADALGEERTGASEALVYRSNEPTFTKLSRWLEKVINNDQRTRRFEAAGLEEGLVRQLNRAIPLGTYGLPKVGSDGQVIKGEKENKLRTFGLPFGAIMILFMLVMTSAPQLLNNVLEEKMQRISEVLVAGVTPFQLLLGKLVGGVMVCLTLACVYLGGVFWATHQFDVAQFVPASFYGWFLLMMILALFMYGAMFSAIGAACSEIRDAQSLMMPVMMSVMIPFFAIMPTIENPNGTLAQVLTFVPTATPMVLLARLLTQPGPPALEVAFALLYCIATTLLLVWASGKIFRIGVLSQGQTPSFRKLIGWVLSK